MKSKITFIYSLLLVCLSVTPAHAQTASSPSIRWICSTEKSRWQELATTNATAATDTNVIRLDAATTFQTRDGFGGCFNELGWEALVALPSDKREAVLKELFLPEGANFTLCRAPIGANDFSLGWYSLDETPGDYAKKHFSATVRPGARRIAVSGGPFKEVVAFQNPDGSKVLAFANDTD